MAIVRSITSRSNIKYSVVECGDQEAVLQALCWQVNSIGNRDPRTRVIIYSPSIDFTKAISHLLKCPAYYSSVEESIQKSEIVRGWIKSGGAIVATSALGAGIDIPDVRYVFHAGLPRTLRDFVQESGRAGRDGAKAESVIFYKESYGRKVNYRSCGFSVTGDGAFRTGQ